MTLSLNIQAPLKQWGLCLRSLAATREERTMMTHHALPASEATRYRAGGLILAGVLTLALGWVIACWEVGGLPLGCWAWPRPLPSCFSPMKTAIPIPRAPTRLPAAQPHACLPAHPGRPATGLTPLYRPRPGTDSRRSTTGARTPCRPAETHPHHLTRIMPAEGVVPALPGPAPPAAREAPCIPSISLTTWAACARPAHWFTTSPIMSP